jgi:Zn-dependent peptidase ImmA (M78 family)
MLIAKGRWPTLADAARHFGVSQQMIRYRLNATGALVRVQRSRTVGAKKVSKKRSSGPAAS